MLYDLVKKVGREWESMGRTHDFEGEKPPSLSKNKGKWVPRIVNRIPAGFDEALQYAKKTKTVTVRNVLPVQRTHLSEGNS